MLLTRGIPRRFTHDKYFHLSERSSKRFWKHKICKHGKSKVNKSASISLFSEENKSKICNFVYWTEGNFVFSLRGESFQRLTQFKVWPDNLPFNRKQADDIAPGRVFRLKLPSCARVYRPLPLKLGKIFLWFPFLSNFLCILCGRLKRIWKSINTHEGFRPKSRSKRKFYGKYFIEFEQDDFIFSTPNAA